MAEHILSFEEIYQEELKWIAERRREYWSHRRMTECRLESAHEQPGHGSVDDDAAAVAAPSGDKQRPDELVNMADFVSDNQTLVGLCLSGEGIRSSTLALGFLQGLAKLRLLGIFDYLSSVSGGGFINAWLAAWVHRQGSLAQVETQMDPSRIEQATVNRPPIQPNTPVDQEPDPVHHVRCYSRYLCPRSGLFRADNWTLAAIYIRNTLVNLFILAALVGGLVFASRLVVWLFGQPGAANGEDGRRFADILSIIAWACTSVIVVQMVRMRTMIATTSVGPSVEPATTECSRRKFIAGVFGLLVLALMFSWAYGPDPGVAGGPITEVSPQRQPGLHWVNLLFAGMPSWTLYAAHVGFLAVLISAVGVLVHRSHKIARRISRDLLASHALLLLFAGLTIYFASQYLVWPLARTGGAEAVTTLGPPIFLVAFFLAGILEAMVLNRCQSEYEFEWRSQISTWLLIIAAGWLAFFGATLYLPRAIAWLSGSGWNPIKGFVTPAAIGAWFLTTLGGVIAGRRAAPQPGYGRRVVLTIAPLVFFAGLLALISSLIAEILGDELLKEVHCMSSSAAGFHRLLGLLVCFGAFVGLLFAVDVNRFSLHALYANRLTRCFLAASRRIPVVGKCRDGAPIGGAPTGIDDCRRDNAVTSFDPADDMPLSDLDCEQKSSSPRNIFRGPYPLFNAAMQISGDQSLGLQERLAESFILAPLYCGSTRTGYARTPCDEVHKGNITLGRAMAISGAAFDSGIPVNTAEISALLTVFNARLGWWMCSPANAEDGVWSARGPKTSLPLLRELVGRACPDGHHVRLTDGGVFDNLGAYELIRRRCRYLIVCDFSGDSCAFSEALANLIRLVRIDFGIRIQIDPSPLRRKTDGFSAAHAAFGSIHYEDRFANVSSGTLILVRSSMTGDEPCDIRQYADGAPDFPHEGTITHFFRADQFEAYRGLGEHLAEQVFSSANPCYCTERICDDGSHRRAVHQLFSRLCLG